MKKHTHLALLYAIIVIGLLISPAMAAVAAPGEAIYRPFNRAQECPDIDGNLIVWEDDRYDELERGVKDIFFATVENIRSTSYGYSFGTRITDDPASQEKPSISGDYIVWQDNRHGDWEIYLYQRSTGEERRLTTDPGKQWLPIVRGNYVAWYDDSSDRTRIVLYDIAAADVKAVIDCNAKTTIPYGSTEFKPALSENYVAWVAAGDDKVHYYDITAEAMVGPVSSGTAKQSWPSLSGSLVAWEDDRHKNSDIYMTDLADPSGGEKRITFDGADQVSAAISGSLIAWEDKRVPARSIYMYDLSPPGEELSAVDAYDIYDEHLYPAASGNTIVWQRGRGPDSNLYIFVYKPGAPVEPVATTIDVTPPAATLEIGDTRAFQATVLDQFGNPMTGITVTWASSNGTVGTVDAGGVFTAKAAGTSTVTASAGSVSGTAAVTVSAEESALERITVTPAAATVALGENRAFTTACYDQFDSPMTGVPVTWTSDNATVGTVDASGTFTALGEGTATVTATAGAKSAKAVVTVIAPAAPVVTIVTVAPASAALMIGGTQAFTATILNQFDNPMTGVNVAWASSDESVGTINESGLFTAKAEGTTTVIATAGDASGTASVMVSTEAPVLNSITVTPTVAYLVVGDGQKFIATGYDRDGNAMNAGDVVWTSDNETVGTIDANGAFAPLTEGTATVTATAGGISGTAAVTVAAAEPALAKIVFFPSAVTLNPGDSRQFEAVGLNCYGEFVPEAAITWTSSDPCVGTVDKCGLFVALCPGTTTLTASGDGATGTTTVTVSCDDPVLSRIAVTPPAITLNIGDAETFAATAYDQFGTVMPEVDIAWETCDETIGTIDAAGHFSALDVGTTTVTATACGVAGTADVTVIRASPGIVVSPPAVTLDKGETRQFTAHGLQDNAGSVVVWSCDDEAVGTIDESGLFTAHCEGTATITATVEGSGEAMVAQADESEAIGTAVVTVRSASRVPARIAVSPSDVTVASGNTLQLTETVYDQYGCEMPEAVVVWESSNPQIGAIGPCGLFTAREDGEVTVTASVDGISGSACVTVGPPIPVPARVEVDPATTALAPEETQEFVATVYDPSDNVMDWVRVAWSSSDPAVGTIDRSGIFTAHAEGTAEITARAGSVEATSAVTVTAAPEPTAEPTTSPTDPGDSGGSDSGSSGPTFSAGICENLRRGETFTFSGITVSSVSNVTITAADTIPRLMLTVKEGSEPGTAGQSAGDVYEYIEITLNWADPQDISRAVIEFTIPADWLREHGMAPEDVRLMRHVNGGWQILETEVIGEEDGNYRFRATTPGFSTFAIAAAPVNMTTPVETVPTVTEEMNVTTTVTTEATTEPTTAAPATTPAAPLVYAPLLAPLAFFLWARKNH